MNRNHRLVIEGVHLELLRVQKGQTAPFSGIRRWAGGACGVDDELRARVRGFAAGLGGRAAWMTNCELELIVPRWAVFERLCSPTPKH